MLIAPRGCSSGGALVRGSLFIAELHARCYCVVFIVFLIATVATCTHSGRVVFGAAPQRHTHTLTHTHTILLFRRRKLYILVNCSSFLYTSTRCYSNAPWAGTSSLCAVHRSTSSSSIVLHQTYSLTTPRCAVIIFGPSKHSVAVAVILISDNSCIVISGNSSTLFTHISPFLMLLLNSTVSLHHATDITMPIPVNSTAPSLPLTHICVYMYTTAQMPIDSSTAWQAQRGKRSVCIVYLTLSPSYCA